MARAPSVRIAVAASSRSVTLVARLFREYAGGLGFPLDFQGFEEELESLPGEYVAPGGALLLARVGRRVAGCVGLRPLDSTTCEMKRLYVRPEFRGHGVGRALAREALKAAVSRGYRRMRLDTVPSMTAALTLYRSMGFIEIPPYRYNPIRGAVYLERELGGEAALGR